MVSAHDTVSDVSDIGAEFDDSSDFLDQNQTVICRLDSSLPATTQSTGYHKRQLQEDLFNFRFLRNMNISSTELFSDIHTLHKAMKQIRINRQLTKYNRG